MLSTNSFIIHEHPQIFCVMSWRWIILSQQGKQLGYNEYCTKSLAHMVGTEHVAYDGLGIWLNIITINLKSEIISSSSPEMSKAYNEQV